MGNLLPRVPIVLDQSAVAIPLTGTLTETAMKTIAVPAGMMGANGQIEIEVLYTLAAANTKTPLIYFGSTICFQQSYTGTGSLRVRAVISNRNSASSQVARSKSSEGEGLAVASTVTGAENSGNAVTISLNGTLSNVGDTLTIESYRVTVFPKP